MPRRPTTSTSFRSVQPEDIEAARKLRDQLGLRLWQVYVLALDVFVAELAAGTTDGRKVPWQASIGPGGNPYTVNLPEDTAAAVREVSDRFQVSRTTVFLTALRRLASGEGR